MNEQAIKMQLDLEKKLDHLCLIHDQPKVHLINDFFKLRSSIDIDAEMLLARFREAKIDDETEEVVKANKNRLEFIRILQELEERCFSQLPKASTTSSSKAYEHFKRRVDLLKISKKDRVKDIYTKLALEIIDETYELEKRLYGEQTIVYACSNNKKQLGHLIYIGQYRLRRHEVEFLQNLNFDTNIEKMFKNSSVLGGVCLPFIVTKNFMLVSRLKHYFDTDPASTASKFIFMGQDEATYAGFSAQSSKIDKKFLSIRFPITQKILAFEEIAGISSCLDLLDLTSAEKTTIELQSSRLENLDFLAPSSAHRLYSLFLKDIHLEAFNGDLLANCVNVIDLILDFSVSSATISNLEFLRPLKRLTHLSLSMRNFNLDLSPFAELKNVFQIDLKGVEVKTGAPKKYPKFNVDVLKHLSTLPHLCTLSLSHFKIDSISKQAFANFKAIKLITLRDNRIVTVNKDVSGNFFQSPIIIIV